MTDIVVNNQNTAGVESNIVPYILALVKNVVKTDALTVQDLTKVMDLNIKFHQSFVDCIDMFSVNDLNEFVRKFKNCGAKDKQGILKEYMILSRGYQNKAQQIENKQSLGAMYYANKKMVEILKEIKHNVDKLFEDKFINIYNCRISHIAVLAVLRQSDILSDYSCTMWTEMVNLVSRNTKSTAKYKVVALSKHTEQVAKIINDMCAKDNTYSFLKYSDNLKRETNDLLLYSNGEVFTKYFAPGSTFTYLLQFMQKALFFISYVASKIDDYQYNRYKKWQDLHEYMINHVAYLKMELSEKDPNSPEYQKLIGIIEAYEQKLSKNAQKMQEYEDS